MEFDDHDEQDEEMGMPVSASYESSLGNNSSRPKMGSAGGEMGVAAAAAAAGASTALVRKGPMSCRYRECLKNHAVGIGGHAVDGCGEFMPAGDDGTLDALKCAACNCHRNFHRKETTTDGAESSSFHHLHHHHHQHPFPQFYRPPPTGYLQMAPQHRPLALPSTSGGGGGHSSRDEMEDDVSNPSGGGGGGSSSRKRFRTKFTPEQKDKMLEFAEKLGWRIQKHDEAGVQQFCDETGVKRHVLKVWMHNNKHTLGKKP